MILNSLKWFSVRMHQTTPFEISLVHELGQDSIRMANDWFFKWHSINIPNRVVDVEDFYGGRISIGGIVLEGQIRDIYWSSVGKHLVDRVHKGFRQWETECAAYPPDLKRSALDALERSLNGYIARPRTLAGVMPNRSGGSPDRTRLRRQSQQNGNIRG